MSEDKGVGSSYPGERDELIALVEGIKTIDAQIKALQGSKDTLRGLVLERLKPLSNRVTLKGLATLSIRGQGTGVSYRKKGIDELYAACQLLGMDAITKALDAARSTRVINSGLVIEYLGDDAPGDEDEDANE